MSDIVKRLREFDYYARKGAHELLDEAAREIERLRGFLTEIEGPCSMDEKTFFARQALETQHVTVHGQQCACSRCEAWRRGSLMRTCACGVSWDPAVQAHRYCKLKGHGNAKLNRRGHTR